MKNTERVLLREAWKQKGKSDGQPPELSTARSYSGGVTGACICTTYGHLMQRNHPGEAWQGAKRVPRERRDEAFQVNDP